jgi:DNA-binding response OmpR family regulator
VTSFVLLMIETEQPEGLSARKLVVETAKFNVLSAYNSEDGLDLLRRFPLVTAVLVHGRLPDAEQVIAAAKSLDSKLPVIVASPQDHARYNGADYVVSSHNPQELVRLLQELAGSLVSA